jgi:L-arabinokinase
MNIRRMVEADLQVGLDAFLETLRARALFEPGASLTVSRAPGRLDVMGGIADYSGSLVLQRPIAEAAFAAVQRIDRPVLEVVSLGRPPCTIPLEALALDGAPLGYEDARRMFADEEGTPAPPAHGNPVPHWVSYVAGVFLTLAHECRMPLTTGARIVVASQVPEGKGVSSSAAVETASMRAAATAFGVALEPRDLALLCQKSENLVSGAPCGVMDQMACVFGERDALLALLCQPAELQPPVPVPEDVQIWGIDSGERHAVGGSDYGAVRAGAFMGLQIVREHVRLRAFAPGASAGQAGVPVDYLANIAPAEFEREFVHRLPEEISGDDFLARYDGTADTVTTVERGRRYRVRAPAAHPVYERQRAERFRQLVRTSPGEDRRVELGALMYESHASYVACGLGSPGTDGLVELVRTEGPEGGLYGARITGGGSGGTVAVIGRKDASAAIARVAGAYERASGHRPYVFTGSSPGVLTFGAQSITL